MSLPEIENAITIRLIILRTNVAYLGIEKGPKLNGESGLLIKLSFGLIPVSIERYERFLHYLIALSRSLRAGNLDLDLPDGQD